MPAGKNLFLQNKLPDTPEDRPAALEKNLFLRNKIAAATERYTVASPSPAHGHVAVRFLIHSSYASAQEISSDFAMYNFLGRTAGDCHDRRESK